MKRNASAHWEGNLEAGKGTISTETGALEKQRYGFDSRFENGIGTNPEELIGAAHAGCFSMALSMILGEDNHTPESIDTKASVEIKKVEGGFSITAIHLDVKASVPGLDAEGFDKAANKAKEGCPVSKVLNAEITMDAKLVG